MLDATVLPDAFQHQLSRFQRLHRQKTLLVSCERSGRYSASGLSHITDFLQLFWHNDSGWLMPLKENWWSKALLEDWRLKISNCSLQSVSVLVYCSYGFNSQWFLYRCACSVRKLTSLSEIKSYFRNYNLFWTRCGLLRRFWNLLARQFAWYRSNRLKLRLTAQQNWIFIRRSFCSVTLVFYLLIIAAWSAQKRPWTLRTVFPL